jgi:hypothetical protein
LKLFAWKFLRGFFFELISRVGLPTKLVITRFQVVITRLDRVTQYAAPSRLHHRRLGILGRPLSRAMTVECVANRALFFFSIRGGGQ